MARREETRVLLAGESWASYGIHVKGAAAYSTASYEEGAAPLIEALEANGIRVDYLPNHSAVEQFPYDVDSLADIQAMVAALDERLSPAVVRSNVVLTSTIMKAAVLDRRLAVNPCVGVKLLEVRRDRIEVMTTEQVLALEEAMAPRWKAVVILGAGAGLRQGEALGVTRDRLDFLRRQLRVDRQLMNLPYQPPDSGFQTACRVG